MGAAVQVLVEPQQPLLFLITSVGCLNLRAGDGGSGFTKACLPWPLLESLEPLLLARHTLRFVLHPDALLTCHQAPAFAPQETSQEKAGIFSPTPKFLSSLVTL